MNEILKIIETRDLYIHLILFKIYLSTKGRTDIFFQGNMIDDFKELLGEDFNREDFQLAEHYLRSEGLTQNWSKRLTRNGRDYFEDWIRNFENLSEEDQVRLQSELSPKMITFFGLAEKANTVLDIVSKLVSLNEKFN